MLLSTVAFRPCAFSQCEGDEIVGDQLQSMQALGVIGNGMGVPEHDNRAVVTTLVVGREGKDDVVDLCCSYADCDAVG